MKKKFRMLVMVLLLFSLLILEGCGVVYLKRDAIAQWLKNGRERRAEKVARSKVETRIGPFYPHRGKYIPPEDETEDE
jgi:hypothetical protein